MKASPKSPIPHFLAAEQKKWSYDRVAQNLLSKCYRVHSFQRRTEIYAEEMLEGVRFSVELFDRCVAIAKKHVVNKEEIALLVLLKKGSHINMSDIGEYTDAYWAIYGKGSPQIAPALIKANHTLNVVHAIKAANPQLATSILNASTFPPLTSELLDSIVLAIISMPLPESPWNKELFQSLFTRIGAAELDLSRLRSSLTDLVRRHVADPKEQDTLLAELPKIGFSKTLFLSSVASASLA